MQKLLDILLQKPVAFATKDIVKLAIADEENEFEGAMFQLFVDYLGKNYVITDNDMEEISQSNEAMHQLILDIYESESLENISSEVGYSEFMNSLISELFVVDKLEAVSLSKWTEFFTIIIEENTIREEAGFKAKSYKMLAFMLPPITKLLKLTENPASNVTEELKICITESVEKIMKNIKISFRFEQISVECARPLMIAIKSHPKAFIQDVESLELFKEMLSYDDRTLLALGLTTLADLCEIDELHYILRDFFFSPDPDEAEENFIDVILLLFNHKNLKSEVIQLLSGIAAFEQDFLNESQRYDLFINVFNKNKKISHEVATLMTLMNCDFWLEIIKMINFYMDPKEIDIPEIITSFDNGTPKKFLQITCAHIDDALVSERAAEMFHAAVKMSEDTTEILSFIHMALPTCENNPVVNCFVLKTFDGLSKAVLANHYREHPEELNIIDTIFMIFEKTNDLMLEKIAVQVLYAFFKVATEKLLFQLFSVSRKFIRMFRRACEEETDSVQEVCLATKKLTALLGCRFWQFMANEDLSYFYQLTAHTIEDINQRSLMYPMTLQFHVNLLKHIWVLLARNKEIPVNPHKLIDKAIMLKNVLEKCYKDENNSYECQSIAIASLLDLLGMFQPGLHDRFESPIFLDLTFPLKKEEVLDIVDAMDKLVYDKFNDDRDKIFFKQNMIHSYESFYVNYTKLPGLTSWEILLRNYHAKVPFKAEIDHIMEHALKNHQKAGIFDKTLAFTILNLSNNIKDISEFRNFFSAIETFLKTHQPEVKDRNTTFAAISSYVLEKLPKHLKNNADYDKRLMIIDCLTIVVKNLEPNHKINMLSWMDLSGVKMTVTESNKIEAFKNMLKE